jgi:hypothetical protein
MTISDNDAGAVKFHWTEWPRAAGQKEREVAMNLQASPAGSRERTLDEVKAELMRRAGRFNPFEEIRREDAERVMNALTSLDKDEWGHEWSRLGLEYEKKGDERAAAGASGKLAAYHHSLRMFRKAAKHFTILQIHH